MTQVINLFAGSGAGKSTTSGGLFYHMKLMNINCELVREFVKTWAWEGKPVKELDQPYIFGKQSRYEAQLYGKVDYIITDSPLYLPCLYQKFHTKKETLKPLVFDFIQTAQLQGVVYHNFLLKRNKKFDTRGRYETLEQALQVDKAVVEFLGENSISYKTIDCDDKDRVDVILKRLNILTGE